MLLTVEIFAVYNCPPINWIGLQSHLYTVLKSQVYRLHKKVPNILVLNHIIQVKIKHIYDVITNLSSASAIATCPFLMCAKITNDANIKNQYTSGS